MWDRSGIDPGSVRGQFGNPLIGLLILSVYEDNAFKYAKKVKIIQEKFKKNILIFIEDDGPGIPVSEYENVFKPFYKIDRGRGDSKSSVGLGLSISSDIIRSHGGNIELGKSELGGLKIKISLPV